MKHVLPVTNVNPTILVVEDNPNQQMVIRILLTKYGFDSHIVDNGQAAIDATSCCVACYAAVLMDVKLTDMDGYECTRRIREIEQPLNRKTVIIAVTAHAMHGDREKCLAAGMDDYLAKPFTAESFRAILLRWTYNSNQPNLRLLPPSAPQEGQG